MLPEFPLAVRQRHYELPAEAAAAAGRQAGLALSIGRRARPGRRALRTGLRHYQSAVRSPAFFGAYRALTSSRRTGAANLNLMNLVHRDLRLDLRAALHQAIEEQKRVEHLRIPVSGDGRANLVSLIVEPLLEGKDLTALVVLFHDAGPIPPTAVPKRRETASADHVERLEGQLRLTQGPAAGDDRGTRIARTRSCRAQTRNISRSTRSCSPPTRSWRPRRKSCSRSTRSCTPSIRSWTIACASWRGRTATSAICSNPRRSPRSSSTTTCRVRSFTPIATEFFHLLESDVGRPIDHLGLTGRVSGLERRRSQGADEARDDRA